MKLNKKITKAVFPVGGLGTRFLPATKSLPKEMLPVASKPLIQYAFEEAREAGIEQFIFVTGRNKNAISNHFDHSYELQSILTDSEKQDELALTRDWLPPAGHIAFLRQRDPLGLGHAVWCARNFIGNEAFAVILADEMLLSENNFLKSMCNLYEEKGGNIIGVAEVPKEDTKKYGIIDTDDQGEIVKIKSMIEKPNPSEAPSNLSIIGRYILEPNIFNYLENIPKGKNGEIQLTDAMVALLKEKMFYGLKFKGQRFDCGNQVGFLAANIAYALKDTKIASQVKQLLMEFNKVV
ncbi:MAG: UTP--glucose-1-phosphate uridylyltransferase GalU [Alphaproteobacteria bacterium]